MAETKNELPEAFTEQESAPKATQVYDDDPTSERETTSTGLNRVDEGSKESFPGSDVPSTSPPTTLADTPAEPTA